ncbi:putative 4-hydroxy-4-methyl-2-oxoglutarate aldolase [Chlorella vulgaris]
MALSSPATADLCDAHIDTPVDTIADSSISVVLPNVLRDFGGRISFHGQAVTARCYESNVLICQLLDTPGQGRVLVVDGGGSLRCALLGDRLAQLAADNDWSGLIVNGCVRDTAALAKINIGIKAIAPCPLKSSKRDPGLKAVRVIIGGVQIRPGDWVYADADGVLVSKEELSV